MSQLQVLGNRVLVRPDEHAEKSAGGVYIPEAATYGYMWGTVVSVGTEEPISVKEGDRVLYNTHTQTNSIMVGDQKLVILEHKYLLGKEIK